MPSRHHKPTLHHRVATKLKEYIRAHHQPGEALPPVRELSAKMRVSTPTLRAAQALLCQEGYLQPMHGSGVYVLDRVVTNLVALVSDLDVLHPGVSQFFRGMLHHLRGFFAENGVRTRLYLGEIQPGEPYKDPSCREFVADVLAHRFDGIVAVATDPLPVWMKGAEQFDIPVVGGNHRFRQWVSLDNQQLIREGLGILREQGARRVAVLAWGDSGGAGGFPKALQDAGLSTREGWIRTDVHPSLPGGGWEEFREVWSAHAEKPEGLLIADEMLYAQALLAIQELGLRIPEDLRIVASVNRGAGLVHPFPVTLMEFDPKEMAEAMGGMMLKLLRREKVSPAQVVLQPRVVKVTPPQPPSILTANPPSSPQKAGKPQS